MSWIPKTIPDGWIITKIGNITEVIRGASPRPKGDPKYFGGNIPWIMIADVSKSQGRYISETRDTVTEEGALRSRYLKAGTLILSNSGTVCVPKILAVDGCIHDGFVAFPDLPEGLEIFYLYDFFLFIRPQIIQKYKQGVTQVNLNLEIVRDIDLLLPPLNEQRRLVTKIESLKARTARVKDSLSTIPALLDQFRQSVLAAAFRGALTADWREQNPDVEPADVLLEKIRVERRRKWEEAELAKMTASGKAPKDDKWKERYKEAKQIDITNLPELPDGWEWATMEEIADIDLGKMLDRGKEQRGKLIPYLRNINVRWGYFDLSDLLEMDFVEDEIERFNLKRDDILVCEGGEPGRAAVWEYDNTDIKYQKTLHRVRSFSKIPPFWFVYHLKFDASTGSLENYFSGSTIKHFTKESFQKYAVRLTSIDEQKEIVHRVQLLFKVADTIEQQYQQTFGAINQLDQSILAQAFRGALVPQDPNDEPASVLLERIRAEREKNTGATSKRSKKSADTSPSQSEKSTGVTSKRSNKSTPFKEAIQMKLKLE